MEAKKYVHWQEEDMWLGYLEEYPDYWTQGRTLEELKEMAVFSSAPEAGTTGIKIPGQKFHRLFRAITK